MDGLSFHPGHRQVYEEEEAEHPGPKGEYICMAASRAYRTQPTSGITSPDASESFTAETNYSGPEPAPSPSTAIGTSFDVVQAATGDTTYSRTRPQLEYHGHKYARGTAYQQLYQTKGRRALLHDLSALRRRRAAAQR